METCSSGKANFNTAEASLCATAAISCICWSATNKTDEKTASYLSKTNQCFEYRLLHPLTWTLYAHDASRQTQGYPFPRRTKKKHRHAAGLGLVEAGAGQQERGG